MFTLRAWTLCLFSQSCQYPNLSEGAGSVGKRPFSGVTKSGRIWRKVPESDVRSVGQALTD